MNIWLKMTITIIFILFTCETVYLADNAVELDNGEKIVIVKDNLIINGSFELVSKDGKKAKGWGQGGRLNDTDVEWGIDSSTSIDGKFSYKLGKTLGAYASVTQGYGTGLISDIKRPMLLSAWIKTKDIADKPGQRRAFFGIYTHPEKGSNSGCIAIASLTGTTEWKKYEKIIYPDLFKRLIENAKTVDRIPYRWEIRANLCNQEGCMWIDKVELKTIAVPPLKISLNSKEYWGSSKSAMLNVNIDFRSVNKAELSKVRIIVLDNSGKEHYTNFISADKEVRTVMVPIKQLPYGRFKIKVSLLRGASSTSLCDKSVDFQKVKDPFE
jgi:hypothetical protein